METPLALRQALPYIQKFSGQVVVLKFSGKNLESENFHKIVEDISVLHALNIYPIIVHGAGPQIEKYLPQNSKKIRGLRVTSSQEIKVIEEVLPKLSKDMCEIIEDWQMMPKYFSKEIFSIKPKNFPEDAGKHYTGEIIEIDKQPLQKAIANGFIPIFSSLLYDCDGNPWNVNADEIALLAAKTLEAKKLIFFSDVQGVLDKKKNIISVISLDDIPKMEENGTISGGMIPKLDSCKNAILGGVKRCHIVSGLSDGALLEELFTVEGVGTMIIDTIDLYQHIRPARTTDIRFLKNIHASESVSKENVFIFEVDGQIMGYLEYINEKPTTRVIQKFKGLEIEKILMQYAIEKA